MVMTRRRVLVAEDDAHINRMISFKIQKEGFEVTSVSDGLHALEAALSLDVDAVILDLMMPSMDGLQVLKRVRERKPSLPVIILSAKGQERDVVTGFELGATDYVTKPFRPGELIVRLKRLLGV